MFENTDIITYKDLDCLSFCVPEYEVLHTQGKDYIVEELLRVMKDWGISL